MGAGQSTANSQAPPRALHTLRVTPSSPASQTTIEPFFDFVVGFQGDDFSSTDTADATELEKIVEKHEGRTLNLLVWNSKSQQTRVVPIVPSRHWALPHSTVPDPREPETERKPSLLGLSMRMCQPELALDNVWHVLDVLEGSPAESAGLVPYGDWIIGWSGGALSAEGDFYEIVENHIEKPLRVYVYSYDFDTIREVVLVPNRQWGGEGLLGCVFGFGLLHRIPPLPQDREPGATPPELSEDLEGYDEQQLFVPADYHGESEEQDFDEEELRWQQEEWMRRSYASASSYDHVSANGNETISAYSVGPSVSAERDFSSQEQTEHDDSGEDIQTSPLTQDGLEQCEDQQIISEDPRNTQNDENEATDDTPCFNAAPSAPHPDDTCHLVDEPKSIPQAVGIPPPFQLQPQAPEDETTYPVASSPVPVHVTPSRAAFLPYRVGSPRIGSPRLSTPTPRMGSFTFMNGIGISPRTPSWGFDLSTRDREHHLGTTRGVGRGDSDGLDQGNDFYDGDEAVSEADTDITETTELDSEVTSQAGSLTSVD